MKGSHFVPSLLVLFSLLLPVLFAQQCRNHKTCTSCLQDPQCGWCETYENCDEGSASGPSLGSCPTWDSDVSSCPSSSSSPSPSPSPLGGDWPMFGGSPSHNGYRPIDLDVTGAKMMWSTSYGLVSSSSVICDGMVLATVYQNPSLTCLSALDLVTGDPVFELPLGPGTAICPPSCHGGIAYIQILSALTNVYAVDLATQKILWTSKYFGSEAHAFNYGAVPHPDNGIIYYPGGAAPATLIALNSTNGAVIFQANLVRSPIGTDSWTPTIWNKRGNEIYWPSESSIDENFGIMGSNDATSGLTNWESSLPTFPTAPTQSVVAIANDIALVSFHNPNVALYAVRLSNQATIWNFTSSKDVFMTPTGIFPDHSASTDGKVAAITASNQIFLLDLETGKSLSNLTCIGCGGQPIITPKFLVSAGGDGLTYVVPRSGGDAIALEAGGTIALSGSVVVVTNVRKFPAAVVAFQLLGE